MRGKQACTSWSQGKTNRADSVGLGQSGRSAGTGLACESSEDGDGATGRWFPKVEFGQNARVLAFCGGVLILVGSF